MSSADPALWDEEAAAFDEAADHGLLDPGVRAAWREPPWRALQQRMCTWRGAGAAGGGSGACSRCGQLVGT